VLVEDGEPPRLLRLLEGFEAAQLKPAR